MAVKRHPDQLFPDLLHEAVDSDEAEGAPSNLLNTILRSVAPATKYEGFVSRVAFFLDLDPDRTLDLLRTAADPTAPDWSGPDDFKLVHFAGGPQRAEAHCGLVRVEPGVHFPRHRHRGDEWAFVLSGRAREDTGTLWNPGDLVRNVEGSSHSFEVLGDEPFVFVVVLADWIEIEKA